MNDIYKKHELYGESILIREFSGVVCADDIVNSWNYLVKQHLIITETKGIINNFLCCDKLEMNLESFKTVLAFLKSQPLLKSIKIAVVTDNPDIIIFPILGENQVNELNIKPFSSVNAASKWILTGVS